MKLTEHNLPEFIAYLKTEPTKKDIEFYGEIICALLNEIYNEGQPEAWFLVNYEAKRFHKVYMTIGYGLKENRFKTFPKKVKNNLIYGKTTEYSHYKGLDCVFMAQLASMYNFSPGAAANKATSIFTELRKMDIEK